VETIVDAMEEQALVTKGAEIVDVTVKREIAQGTIYVDATRGHFLLLCPFPDGEVRKDAA